MQKYRRMISNILMMSLVIVIVISLSGSKTAVDRVTGFKSNLVSYIRSNVIANSSDYKSVFLNYIPNEDRDSVYLLDDDPNWYIQNGLLPCKEAVH